MRWPHVHIQKTNDIHNKHINYQLFLWFLIDICLLFPHLFCFLLSITSRHKRWGRNSTFTEFLHSGLTQLHIQYFISTWKQSDKIYRQVVFSFFQIRELTTGPYFLQGIMVTTKILIYQPKFLNKENYIVCFLSYWSIVDLQGIQHSDSVFLDYTPLTVITSYFPLLKRKDYTERWQRLPKKRLLKGKRRSSWINPWGTPVFKASPEFNILI